MSTFFGQQISCPGGQIYTIRAGDTIFRLAQRFEVPVDAILDANPGLDPDRLRVGQRICIPVPQCPQGELYTVRAGDTIFRIAQRFGVSVDAILEANPGVDPDALFVGQRLCIPTDGVPGCPDGQIYVIRAGDTFFSIARRFNVTVNELIAANPGVDPNALRIGQRICIPIAEEPTCPDGQFYVIRAGDTFFSIARRFNVTVNELIAANPGVDPNALRIGQRICIPIAEEPTCPDGQFYVIRAGDTFFSLAQRFNVGVNELIAANPGVDPNALRIGQRICIPGAEQPGCPDGQIYVVRAGDNLYSIARRFNVTVDELIEANPQIEDPNRLFVGQNICIPTQEEEE